MAGIEIVYAIHNFEAENQDEIAFSIGEPIFVLEKDDGYNDGWWQGRNVRGEIGLFPVNYTSPQLPTNKSAPNLSTTTTTTPTTNITTTFNDGNLKRQHQPSSSPLLPVKNASQEQFPAFSKSGSSHRTSEFGPRNKNTSMSSLASSIPSQQQPPQQQPLQRPSTTTSKNIHKALEVVMALPPFKDVSPEEWSVDEVTAWMYEMGFESLAENFKAQEITGDILLELTLDTLKELDVNTFGKRFKLHTAINALREFLKRSQNGKDHPETDDVNFHRSISPLAGTEYASSIGSEDQPRTSRLHSADSIAANAYRQSGDSVRIGIPRKAVPSENVKQQRSNQLLSRSCSMHEKVNPQSVPDMVSQHQTRLPAAVQQQRTTFSPIEKPQTVLHVANRASMDSLVQRSTMLDVTPDMEGWLHKQGDRYKTWNRRWFVLKGVNLFYFKTPKDVRMKGIINLRGYRVVCDPAIQAGKYSFRLQHEYERTFLFYTDYESTMKSWINVLMKATIARDYAAPVLSSSTIPTVSLDTARRMKPRPPSMILYKSSQGSEKTSDKQPLLAEDSPIHPNPPQHCQDSSESACESSIDHDVVNELKEYPPPPQRPPNSKTLGDSGFESAPISSALSPPHTSLLPIRQHSQLDEDLIDPHHSNVLESNRPGGLKRLTEESHSSSDPSVWRTSAYISWMQQLVDRKVTSLNDLQSGELLIELLENLSGKEIRRPPSINAAASMQELDNLVAAFKFMGREGVEVDGRYTIKDIFTGNEPKIKEMLDAIKTWSDTAHDEKKASGGTFGERDNFRALDQDLFA
ncbi:hypothetical protein BX666DRAFT_1995771 [Dichotomocladium elegans]|nr:hypothetical protein BX666DRAFT_1995771 [Dichotomocladium elegans]